ncbi:MAG: hypothetical protein ABEH66_03935 [Halobacteriales archaeon]
MADPWISPGQAAEQAFRIGMGAATVGGLAVLGLLYWSGAVASLSEAIVAAALFPPYLLFAAAALSKWLGLDTDTSDLRPVYRGREPDRRKP